MPSRNGRSAKRSARARAIFEPRPLTQRELEVVEWIAAGKRNREIGEILGCSSRTVQKHVQHILEKLLSKPGRMFVFGDSRIAMPINLFVADDAAFKKSPKIRHSAYCGLSTHCA